MTPRSDPDTENIRRPSARALIWTGLLVAVVLATVVALFASSSPDGLEKVAEDTGFASTAQDSAVAGSPLADYQVGGADSDSATWRSVVAGVAGLAIMGGVAFLGFAVLARGRRTDTQHTVR